MECHAQPARAALSCVLQHKDTFGVGALSYKVALARVSAIELIVRSVVLLSILKTRCSASNVASAFPHGEVITSL